MKQAHRTPDEYRQLAHQFKGFAEWSAWTRQLFSMPCPINSHWHTALVKAHSYRVFTFKDELKTLAYIEFPSVNFNDDSLTDSQGRYQHPKILPGYTVEKTAFLLARKEQRWSGKKRKPLHIEELRIVSKFLHHVYTVCQDVIKRTQALEGKRLPAAEALLTTFLIVDEAFITVSRKIDRGEK